MYSVSNAYLAAIKQPIQVHKVRGTIGSVAFTDENILEGSFSISNQSTDTSDIVLGSCYIGQLSATFTGLNISRTEWMNKVITPYFQLWFDAQNYEEVPLGVFTIKEVNHTAEGVEVVAYDNMYKFDKKFKKSGLNMVAKPYNFLIVFCQKCGIELGMNSTQVEALPNGNADLYLCGVRKSTTTYANDIETYRDALFWLAQCLGSFATMRRDGKLVLRAYKDTVDDSISDLYRLSGAKFADYITSYTGIYTESLYDGETTYYGYDLATLQQMRDTAMQELEQIITDLAELEEEYRQGQITEEEYKAQKKVLTSEKKAKEKYISWLDKMIAQAQAEGDGAYMDLGANPFFQRRDANIPSIADATLATTLRSHILSALGKIEYTPFSCSSVFGVHYDLGDVIQFSGGHADDDLGCIMSYEWTLHGQYNMEGYGVNPDEQNVKDVKKKQSERAQKNALAASRNSTSDDVVAPNNGDIKIKMTTVNGEVLDINNMTNSSTTQHPITVDNFTGNNEDGYSFSISGYPDSHGYGENVYFSLDGLNNGGKYTVEFDAQFTRADGGWPWSSYYDNVGCNDLRIDLRPDMQERHYSGTFTYNDGNAFWFVFPRVNDNYHFTCAFSNMKFTPAESGVDGMEAYDGENWQNIDYVKTISQVQTSTGGTKIATANNSDGTNTDIYAPSVSANPSGASTNLTSLGIAGTDYVIKDANAIPSTEKGANNGVAELDTNGKVPSSQLPSYVDDVLEYASLSNFPATGESGKIYIAVDTNKSYRWSGSTYVEISSSLALGETSSTAYRGDRGKTAYDHATESGKISAAVASGLYKIAATAQGHIAGLTAVQKSDLTALGVADANNIPTITDTYDGTSSDGMSGKAVKSAIDALDVTTSGAGAGKTLTALSQTDGKISATFGNISITKSQVSDFPTLATVATSGAYNDLSGKPTIPTVYNKTITIQKNSTTVDSFTLNQSTDKTINISVPTKTSDLTNDSGFVTDGQGTKTVKANLVTLNDAAAIYAEDITADITAVQDLHGYDKPWVGGAGKNKIDVSIATQTVNGVTFTVSRDSDGNFNKLTLTGTNSLSSTLNKEITDFVTLPAGTYIISGTPSNASANTARFRLRDRDNNAIAYVHSQENEFTLSSATEVAIQIQVAGGYAISGSMLFYPMIRLSTESDSTFAPYTNICPIQGHDECEVERVGANQWDEEWENGYYNRQTGEKAGNTDTKYYRSKNFIPCFPSEQYYIKLPAVHKDNNTYFAVIYYDKDKNFISSAFTVLEPTITTPANAYYLTFYVEVGTSGATYNNDIAINHPASVTTYSPYQGKDYVIPLSNKNLIPMQFDNTHILAYNTSGSWNDHTYTEYGVDITVYTLTKYSDIVTGIRIKGDATNNLSFMLCSYGDDFVFTEALKMNASGTSNADIDIIAMDKNNTSKAEIRTTLSSADVSVTDNKFAKVVVIVNSGFSGDVMIYPQIRKARYSSDFEPHNPRLPEVVYGATLDVTSGELVVDTEIKNPKDLTIAKNSQSADNYAYYIANLYGVADFSSGSKWVCSHLERSSSINNAGTFYPSSSYSVCYMNFGSIIGTNTVDGFKQYCADNNVQLVYPLAAPITYQLTPTEVKLLLNLNNITASTGQVQVKYQPNNAIGEAIGYIQDYIERHAPKTYYPKII